MLILKHNAIILILYSISILSKTEKKTMLPHLPPAACPHQRHTVEETQRVRRSRVSCERTSACNTREPTSNSRYSSKRHVGWITARRVPWQTWTCRRPAPSWTGATSSTGLPCRIPRFVHRCSSDFDICSLRCEHFQLTCWINSSICEYVERFWIVNWHCQLSQIGTHG